MLRFRSIIAAIFIWGLANTTSQPSSPPPPPPPPTPTPSLNLLCITISTKLDRTNFLGWQSQIIPILHGYDLYDYIIRPIPGRQDQILLGWLRTSLSETLLAQVASYNTSFDLWTNLNSTFAATTRARLLELRRKLLSTTKKGMSCDEYLIIMRSIADELTFIGHPVSEDDLVMYILGGLGPDFNSLVAAVTTSLQNKTLSLAELRADLLSYENLLQTQHSSFCSLSSASNLNFSFSTFHSPQASIGGSLSNTSPSSSTSTSTSTSTSE